MLCGLAGSGKCLQSGPILHSNRAGTLPALGMLQPGFSAPIPRLKSGLANSLMFPQMVGRATNLRAGLAAQKHNSACAYATRSPKISQCPRPRARGLTGPLVWLRRASSGGLKAVTFGAFQGRRIHTWRPRRRTLAAAPPPAGSWPSSRMGNRHGGVVSTNRP